MALTCPVELDLATLRSEILTLPVAVTSSFAGVGNPHAIAPIDVSAIGVDMTAAMRERWRAPNAAGLTNVEVRDGDATRPPLDDGTVE